MLKSVELSRHYGTVRAADNVLFGTEVGEGYLGAVLESRRMLMRVAEEHCHRDDGSRNNLAQLS